MSRYIDADDFKREMEKYLPEDRELALKVLKSIKTADVVEVIRCKDCKWGSNLYRPDTYACDITNQFNGGNSFCSYGERRTDDDRNG